MEKSIKVTIITVCHNEEKKIEATILSVLKQTYEDIEYILIDGNSQDKTLQIIEKYSQDKRIRYVSEPDKGIYDAMNKGSRLATGDYIEFLNAGDLLVDSKVIEEIAYKLKGLKSDIVYGDIIYCYPDGSKKIRKYGQFCSSYFYYLLGDCINHQAMFAKRECAQENCFDITYKICADREWMLRMKKQHKKYKALGMLVCEYSLDEDSASIKNKVLYKKEANQCIKEHLKGGVFLFKLFEIIRGNKLSSQILHKAYELVFIRNK